jgi:hypothetical protein
MTGLLPTWRRYALESRRHTSVSMKGYISGFAWLFYEMVIASALLRKKIARLIAHLDTDTAPTWNVTGQADVTPNRPTGRNRPEGNPIIFAL